MSSCNGKPITAADIQQAAKNIETAFREAQDREVLPRSYKLQIIEGYPGYAGFSTRGTMAADPVALACMTPTQTGAVVAHEVGHLHYIHPAYEGYGFLLQVLLPFLAARAIITGRLRSPLLTRVWHADFRNRTALKTASWPRMSAKKRALVAAGMLLLHEGQGRYLLQNQRQDELFADGYAARYVGSAEPMVEALEKYQTFRRGPGQEMPGAIEDHRARIANLRLIFTKTIFGFWGEKVIHPPASERISLLREGSPEIPPSSLGQRVWKRISRYSP